MQKKLVPNSLFFGRLAGLNFCILGTKKGESLYGNRWIGFGKKILFRTSKHWKIQKDLHRWNVKKTLHPKRNAWYFVGFGWCFFFKSKNLPCACKRCIKTYKNQSLSKRNLNDWSNYSIPPNVPGPLETRVKNKVIIEGVSRCLRSPDQFGRKCRKGGGGTSPGFRGILGGS